MTQSDIGIVEKLTKPDAWSAHFHGFGSYTEVEESVPFEAAAFIMEMVEALERDRAALEAMMNAWFDYHDSHSLTEPVTGAAGNAFDKALAARDAIDAALAKVRSK